MPNKKWKIWVKLRFYQIRSGLKAFIQVYHCFQNYESSRHLQKLFKIQSWSESVRVIQNIDQNQSASARISVRIRHNQSEYGSELVRISQNLGQDLSQSVTILTWIGQHQFVYCLKLVRKLFRGDNTCISRWIAEYCERCDHQSEMKPHLDKVEVIMVMYMYYSSLAHHCFEPFAYKSWVKAIGNAHRVV